MSPTDALAARLKRLFSDRLGIGYIVLVIGGKHDLTAISRMNVSIIDNSLFRMMMLGLPNLVDSTWLNGITDMETEALPFELIADEKMKPLVQAALDPSPETLSRVVDPDLQSFFVDLYNREEMTDLVWLNTFRILSCRMGRHKHVVAFILYVPLDKPAVIEEIMAEFRRIGDHHGITNDYGFITPLDEGKRAVFEYDYYVEQTDEEDRERMGRAMPEIDAMIETFCARVAGVRWIKYTLYQGFCRTEELLYGGDM